MAADKPLVRPVDPEPLPGPVMDNHTHLDHEEPGDVAELMARAAAAGVTRAVQIGCNVPAAHRSMELVDQFPQLRAGVALHPNEAPRLAQAGDLERAFADIVSLAERPETCVISETGMDFFRTDGTDDAAVAAQEKSFRWHIDLAKELGKPMQIHNRDADEAVLRILTDMGAPDRTVLHCFSSDAHMAQECVSRGYYLSFSGNVTFKNAQAVRDAVRVAGLGRIVVETDAPYLTPTPNRGKPNASYLMPHTVRMIAEVLDEPVEKVCQATWETSQEIYGVW